jgi:hypothetical protein
MSSFSYTPPYGFGNEVPGKKKNPYEVDAASIGGGSTAADGGALPGLGYVGTYTPQTAASGIDFSQPTQLQFGSRDAALESDAPYMQLLARLGLDEKTARMNMVAMQGKLGENLKSQQADLARQSQEDRYGIDARLRSRGVRGTQRESLNLKQRQNEARGMSNLELQSADQYNELEQGYASTKSALEREGIQGAASAAGRLQTQRDAIQARLDAQRWQDEQLRQSGLNTQQLIDAMNANATQQQQPAMQAPTPGASSGNSFADWYGQLDSAGKAAWDAFARLGAQPPAAAAPSYGGGGGGGYSAGGGGGYTNPAAPPAGYVPNAPPPLALSPSPGNAGAAIGVGAGAIQGGTKPKQPLRPMRGYY